MKSRGVTDNGGLLLVGGRSMSGLKWPMRSRCTRTRRLRHRSVIGLERETLVQPRDRGANGCATGTH